MGNKKQRSMRKVTISGIEDPLLTEEDIYASVIPKLNIQLQEEFDDYSEEITNKQSKNILNKTRKKISENSIKNKQLDLEIKEKTQKIAYLQESIEFKFQENLALRNRKFKIFIIYIILIYFFRYLTANRNQNKALMT